MFEWNSSIRAYYNYLDETWQRSSNLDDLIKQELLENFSWVYIHSVVISSQEWISKIVSLLLEDWEFLILQTENIDIKILKNGVNKFIIFRVDWVYKLCARCVDHYEYHADIRDGVVLPKFPKINMRWWWYMRGDLHNLYFYWSSEWFGSFSEKNLLEILQEAISNVSIDLKQEKYDFSIEEEVDLSKYYQHQEEDWKFLIDETDLDNIPDMSESDLKDLECLFDDWEWDIKDEDIFLEEEVDFSDYYSYLEDAGETLVSLEDLSKQDYETYIYDLDRILEFIKKRKTRRGTKWMKHKMIWKKIIEKFMRSLTLEELTQWFGLNLKLSKRKIHWEVSYFGLCPFHQEKTPSFCVTPSNGHYNCFWCQFNWNFLDVYLRINWYARFWEAFKNSDSFREFVLEKIRNLKK